MATRDEDSAPVNSPYAEAARAYLDAGWFPIRLPLNAKEPPPPGYTGRTAVKRVTAETVARWSAGEPHNIAIVLPDTVIGIDVDAYGEKDGAVSLTAAEASYGVLPESPRLTSRDDGVSGIRFYRVPPGSTFVGDAGPGIDVIQHGHRYAVAWPSVHPEGRTYRWLEADGTERASVPLVDDLPELPGPWLAALDAGGAEAVSGALDPLSVTAAKGWLRDLIGGQPCRLVADARDTAVRNLASNRHDTAVAAVWQLASLGAEGHRGVRDALRTVRAAFTDALGGDRDGGAEWNRSLLSAVRKLDGRTAQPCQCASTEVTSAFEARCLVGREIVNFGDGLRSLWGPKESPLWSPGQSLLIVGPSSVGKSTLAQLVMLARIGMHGDVLGYPVADDGGRVLYVAADRPMQIREGIARMVDVGKPQFDRLVMWPGPLPVPITAEANWKYLTEKAREVQATTIVIDSVKDVLPNVNDETMAGGYNQARQYALANGIEWLEIHHSRKATSENRAPRRLDDVRGSGTLTAGAGSVISLYGESGAAEIRLTHLKPLAGTHPPMMLTLDGDGGEVTVSEGNTVSPVDGAFLFIGGNGLTANEATRYAHGESATPRDRDRIRKDLERRAQRGELVSVKEGKTRRYFLAASRSTEIHLDSVQMDAA